jgi:hypothetical protein
MSNRKRVVGPAMEAALRVIHYRFGGAAPCKLAVAEEVGPYGSRYYGYRTVDRVIAAGLAKLDPKHPNAVRNSAGAVVLTDAGRAEVTGEK